MTPSLTLARFALAVACAGLAAGCSTFPNERPTNPPLPTAWTEAATSGEEAALVDWWRAFNDPLLDALVAEGLERSPGVRQAVLRVSEARSDAYGTISGFAPEVSVQANGQYTRAVRGPRLPGAAGPEREQAIGAAGAAISWEIPLFSRLQNAAIGAGANTRAALADERGAKVALAADLAQAYVDLRTAQNQGAALREAAQIGAQLADILDISAGAGFASLADAADARRQAELNASRVPDVLIAARRAANRLSTLRAYAPGAEADTLAPQFAADGSVPSTDLRGAPAAPADLIRLRPDIARAEAQAILAGAQVGLARDDILPRLSLSGSILASDNVLGAALATGATTATLAPLITMPLIDWGARAATIRSRKSAFQRALITYEDTVIQGVSEASNALAQLSQGGERLRAARAAEANAAITARGTSASFEAGIASLTDRLRADQQLLDARLTRIQAESQAASAAIAVYRAFGGGAPILEPADLRDRS